MFAELPKLFGKNFAIGFFIPASTLEIALWYIAVEYGFRDAIKNILKTDLLIGATLVVFIVWLGAILLMAVNRPLLRTLQGYGKWHPLKCRRRGLSNEFNERMLPAIERQKEVDEARAQGHPDPELAENHRERLQSAVTDFPDKPGDVLPTRFGNRMRAFEVYSRVVYGLDAIPAWPRLQAVLPAQIRERLDEAKAQVDFAVNLLVGATAALIWLLAISSG